MAKKRRDDIPYFTIINQINMKMEGELMNYKRKRIISLILTLAIVIGLLPGMILPARADDTEVTVTTWSELKEALSKSGTASKVKLGNDIEHEYSYYYNYELDHLKIPISTKKTLDLNGRTLELRDMKTDYQSKSLDKVMFAIEEGGSLHVIDSSPSGDGKVWYHSQLAENISAATNRGGHHIFLNNGGELVIDGGKFIAGRKSKTWCVGIKHKTNKYSYNGWAYNLSSGNVLLIKQGQTIINGGTFHSYDDFTIKVDLGAKSMVSELIINGGDYKVMGGGIGGKNVFHNLNSKEKVNFELNGGTFSAENMMVRMVVAGYWLVYDAENGIVGTTKNINFNQDALYKTDGKERNITYLTSNWSGKSKKFEVIPGTPKVSRLLPEVE
ncbi:MAG TPA: hypothetical protein GXZ78_00965, partial [Eubacteriaceae bacterium]|nr:hypothetical protein [Eubacteriaceae bacterium]